MADRRIAWAALLALTLPGCVAESGSAGSSSSPAFEPFPAAPELMAADRAFAAASRKRGAQAWADVWAESGLLVDATDGPAVGPDAVRRAVSPMLEREGERFRWEPTTSGMLWPDSLGYTMGDFWIEAESGGTADPGRYLTVWQRVGDVWKVALDLQAPDPDGAAAASDFDFWVGDWEVDHRIWSGSGPDYETYPALDRVRAIGGRPGVLAESWQGEVRFGWTGMQGPTYIRGASIRVFDPATDRWRIFWMDTLTPAFGDAFAGRFTGDGRAGAFHRATPMPDGRPLRIRFRQRRDGSVLWDLSIPETGGNAERTLWSMTFRRR